MNEKKSHEKCTRKYINGIIAKIRGYRPDYIEVDFCFKVYEVMLIVVGVKGKINIDIQQTDLFNRTFDKLLDT